MKYQELLGATTYHRLRQAFRNPYGFCAKVCPVGEDRKLFQSTDVNKYFHEQKVLEKDSTCPDYQDWLHIRKHGARLLNEDPWKTGD